MKSKVATIILILCSFIAESTAQNNNFGFKKRIEDVNTEGWHKIRLDAAVSGQTQSRYQDIRIYHIDKRDTSEVPYLLRIDLDEISDETVNVPVINKSTKDGKLYLTLEMKDEHANYIDLEFTDKNFEGVADIEGSNDQREWFSVLKEKRILAISDHDVDFSFTTLSFPLSNYRFLRIQIEANKPLNFISATVKKRIIKNGVSIDHPLTWRAESNKDRQTVVDINFKQRSLINSLKVNISTKDDYYRPFILESVDSIKSEKGWTYYFDGSANGYLTSTDTSAISVPLLKEKKLRLIISNFDNPPLNIKDIQVTGPEVSLVCKLIPGENLLMYGDRRSNPPTYDLHYFEKNIPTDLRSATLSSEEAITKESPVPQSLFEQKMWLWVVMGVIISLLGYFTIRMMRNS